MSNRDGDRSKTLSVLQGGAELAAQAVGSAAGFLLGGPVGAAGGAVLARALEHIGADAAQWWLGPQELKRIGAAAAFAYESINSRILGGETARDDDPWRNPTEMHRSPAEEILEGVLRTAADSWEERKVRYIGLFYASLAFRPDISPGYANTLLRLAGRLGYGEMQLLAFFGDNRANRSLGLGAIDLERDEHGRRDMPDGRSVDLQALLDNGLIGILGSDLQPTRAAWSAEESNPNTRRYAPMALMPPATDLYDLMRLDTMPVEELWAAFQSSIGS